MDERPYIPLIAEKKNEPMKLTLFDTALKGLLSVPPPKKGK
jgi:hypothetical protein